MVKEKNYVEQVNDGSKNSKVRDVHWAIIEGTDSAILIYEWKNQL